MKRIRVEGGYAGLQTTGDPDDRDPVAYPTILSGAIGLSGISDNSFHVVTFNDSAMQPLENEENFTLLDGVTVTAGNTNGATAPSGTTTLGGAGIYIINGASPRIHNAIIKNNLGVSNDPPGPHSGNGAFAYKSSPVFTNCTFLDNVGDKGGHGGGFCLEGTGTARLISCTLMGNHSGSGGGASVVGLSNATNPQLHLINCLITGNSATPSVLSPHPAGGGVSVTQHGARATMINCTFADNISKRGGGFAQFLVVPVSGCAAESDSVGPSYIHNCIFWDNELTDPQDACHPPEVYLTSGELHIENSDISGGEDGVSPNEPDTFDNSINVNPMFADPDGADNTAGTLDDNYRLSCNSGCSPCPINGGSNSLVPADTYNIDGDGSDTEPTPDRELEERIVPVSGGVVDMGAYEHENTEVCAGDTNGDGVVNVVDLLAVINQWDEINCPRHLHCGRCASNTMPGP